MYVIKIGNKYARFASHGIVTLVDKPEQASLYSVLRNAVYRRQQISWTRSTPPPETVRSLRGAGPNHFGPVDKTIWKIEFWSAENEVKIEE